MGISRFLHEIEIPLHGNGHDMKYNNNNNNNNNSTMNSNNRITATLYSLGI